MNVTTGFVALWIYRALGAGLAILLMEWLADAAGEPLSRVPFVTSIVLTFAAPHAPAAQPRAIVVGHLVSAAAGFLCAVGLGGGSLSAGLAVGLSALGMLATGSLHPPAGLDAFLVVTQVLPPHWLLVPILAGAVILAALGRIWAALEQVLFGHRPV